MKATIHRAGHNAHHASEFNNIGKVIYNHRLHNAYRLSNGANNYVYVRVNNSAVCTGMTEDSPKVLKTR